MSKIELICPVCENDISISTREIKLAISHKKETGGNVLVSCPECCRVLVMPLGVPEDTEAVEQWITDVDNVTCVPLLNGDYVRIPSGSITLLGRTTYKPGGGDTALPKRQYMFRYGINPECAVSKNPSLGGKPFVTGGV